MPGPSRRPPALGLAGRALAGVVGLALAGAAPGCEILVKSSTDEALLAAVPLGPARSLDLGYLHSVTRTPVTETLSVDRDGLVQRRIEFLEHGPGMPTEALAGERFQLRQGRFVLDGMNRRIGVLRMRVDPAQFQTLQASGQSLALTHWGARSLTLQSRDCE